MAGIKQIVAPPETFRFPRWKSNINYAKDSVIAHNSYGLDSDSTSLYLAQTFIPAGQNRPNLNANWLEMAADAAAINAVVRTQLDQDSDMIIMRAVNARVDSETARQRQVDSDFQKELDSEAHWWRAKDSDIKRNFARALDSEMHDRRAADSDDRVNADNALDSETHDRKAADSDIDVRLNDHDSDLARLKGWVDTLLIENDSDDLVQNVEHDSDVKMVYHDFRAADSDNKANASKALDSEIRARKAADSDIDVRLDNHDSDITRLKVWVDTLLVENDSDNFVQNLDHDSDVLVLRHDYSAADSEVIAYLTSPTTLDYGTYF